MKTAAENNKELLTDTPWTLRPHELRLGAAWLASGPRDAQDAFLEGMSEQTLLALPYLFEFWAMEHQLPPPGAWRAWVILGGRGAGKTRAGAEWVRSLVEGATPLAPVRPVTSHLGQALIDGVGSVFGAVLPFAQGAGFTQGRVMPFAKGGVVSGPSLFAMRGGTGLMGEAGPEAIMPLARGADGALGVRMQGGGRPVNVVMNITTPDVEGFRRSQSQLAGQMARALGRGQRNG